MGDGNSKGREESSPSGSSQASELPTSRPPSTTASVDSEKKSEPVIRKSARKRVAKRRSPSPSPPPQRKKAPSKPPPKKISSTKPPPKKIARAEPPQHDLMSAKSTKPDSQPKPPPSKQEVPRPKPPPSKQEVLQSKLPPKEEVPRPKPSIPVQQAESAKSSAAEQSGDESDSDSSTIMSDDAQLFPNDRAGVYGHLLRMRQKRRADCVPVVPLPPRIVGGVRDQLAKTKVCNCRRSSCLKLYCDCFMAGLYCTSECNCSACKNNQEHPRDRNMAIDVTLLRNANAFRPRLAPEQPLVAGSRSAQINTSATRAEKGCNCKKSSCLKKYCECFLAAVYCSPLCRCTECKNKVGNEERENLIGQRRSKVRVEATQGNEAETVTTADAVRAGTVAGGVDLSLPPSSYAKTMTLNNGTAYPAVAFGTARSSGTASQATSKRRATRKSATKVFSPNDKYKYETDLQKLWRVETGRVDQTFEKVHKDLQNTTSPKYRVKDSSAKKRDPMIDYRARMAMDHLMEDMKDIVAAVNKSEKNAMNQFETGASDDGTSPLAEMKQNKLTAMNGKPTDGSGASALQVQAMDVDPTASDELVDESALICDEEIESVASVELDASSLLCEEEIDNSENRNLTGDAVRELTILAAQEAAVIRQLAGIIRRKTLEMTKQRLRLVEDARNKAWSS